MIQNQPPDMKGLLCFKCNKPATLWRTHQSPILPWCFSCWYNNLGREETIMYENTKMFKQSDLFAKDIIVLDLEIQDPITEPHQWNETDKIRISVCVVYNFKDGTYSIYGEKDLVRLQTRVNMADLIVTFNGNNFDLPIIFKMPEKRLPEGMEKRSFDILAEIWKAQGLDPKTFTGEHRGYSLSNVAKGTVGRGKIDQGENAVYLFRAGDWCNLINYCIDDVYLTKSIFNIIVAESYINVYRYGKTVKVQFDYVKRDIYEK